MVGVAGDFVDSVEVVTAVKACEFAMLGTPFAAVLVGVAKALLAAVVPVLPDVLAPAVPMLLDEPTPVAPGPLVLLGGIVPLPLVLVVPWALPEPLELIVVLVMPVPLVLVVSVPLVLLEVAVVPLPVVPVSLAFPVPPVSVAPVLLEELVGLSGTGLGEDPSVALALVAPASPLSALAPVELVSAVEVAP
jgi:hypothetical protein